MDKVLAQKLLKDIKFFDDNCPSSYGLENSNCEMCNCCESRDCMKCWIEALENKVKNAIR